MDLVQGAERRPLTTTQRTTVGTTDPGTSEELPWRTTTNSDETGATATVQTGLDATAVRSVVASEVAGLPVRVTSNDAKVSGPTPADRPPVEPIGDPAVVSSAKGVRGAIGHRGGRTALLLIVHAVTADPRGLMAIVRSAEATSARVVMVTVRSVGTTTARVVMVTVPSVPAAATVRSAEATTVPVVMVTVRSVGTTIVRSATATVRSGPVATTARSVGTTTARVAMATVPSAAATTGPPVVARTASGSATGPAPLGLGSVKLRATTGKTATRTAPGRSDRATRTRRSPTMSTRATCTRWHVPS
jgi:hypothetical protein